jgi:homocysteine S-methyltransferase
VTRFSDLFRNGPVLLDGGLGTLLESRGHDVSGVLWSARVLRDEPEAVVAAHAEFFAAGARVATTASYQVSRDGFARAGLEPDDADTALDTSVRLAREAADRAGDGTVVAASIGPYGAVLADGSEYRGDYGLSVSELAAWHRPRIERLWAAGPDVLAIETIPSLAEAEAIARALEGTGATAWLCYTVAGGALRSGESLDDAFAIADASPAIVATGVNCCAPAEVAGALESLRRSTGKRAIAYPNSGEEWDAKNRVWMGDADLPEHLVSGWLDGGLDAVGGCCRVAPEHLGGIARTLAARDR